jgi:hypothetical protein
VHGDTGQIAVANLALPAVEATSDLDSDLTCFIGDGPRASHGSSRAIERGEKTITERFDLSSAESLYLPPHRPVVEV